MNKNIVLNSTDFLMGDYLFFMENGTGRCWRLINPLVDHDKGTCNRVLAFKKIHPEVYIDNLAHCRRTAAGGEA
jgi:hypothetical protein